MILEKTFHSILKLITYPVCGLFCIYSFCSCNQEKKKLNTLLDPRLESFRWIAGDWENRVKEDILCESWYITDDYMLKGNGYEILKGDTVFSENLSLFVQNDSVFYIAMVKGQNDNQPVWFSVTQSSDTGFTCQNKTHDFPQMIRYSYDGKEIIAVTLSGLVDSLPQSQELLMKRAKVRLMPS